MRFIKRLRRRRPEWEIELLSNPHKALDLLDKTRHDVIVSELRLPLMFGEQLLIAVSEYYPYMSRLLISSERDTGLLLESAGVAHQFLAKPCSENAFIEGVSRSLSIRDMLGSSELQKLLLRTTELPTLPKTYRSILRLLDQDNFTNTALSQLVDKDPAICAQVLRVANSSYFGFRREIASIPDALMMMGTKTVKTIILAAHVLTWSEQRKLQKVGLADLWEHSLKVGKYAAQLAAQNRKTAHLREAALTAGLLHDMGKLVLHKNLPEEYEEMWKMTQEKGISQSHAELEIFGASHQEVGAYLFALWGLPDAILEAVAYHHRPLSCFYKRQSVLCFVAAANALLKEQCVVEENSELLEYLSTIGAKSEYPRWKTLIGQVT